MLQNTCFVFSCLCSDAVRAAAAYNITTEAERNTYYRFFLLRLRYHYCYFLWVGSIAVAVGEKGYAFFLLGSLLLLLVLVVLTTSVLKLREVPATVSSFYVAVPYTAMLATSADAVFLSCFLFCPLDCYNPVMVVACAAVETGCMLET